METSKIKKRIITKAHTSSNNLKRQSEKCENNLKIMHRNFSGYKVHPPVARSIIELVLDACD